MVVFPSKSSFIDGGETTVSGGVGGLAGAGVVALSVVALSPDGGELLQPLVSASAWLCNRIVIMQHVITECNKSGRLTGHFYCQYA